MNRRAALIEQMQEQHKNIILPSMAAKKALVDGRIRHLWKSVGDKEEVKTALRYSKY